MVVVLQVKHVTYCVAPASSQGAILLVLKWVEVCSLKHSSGMIKVRLQVVGDKQHHGACPLTVVRRVTVDVAVIDHLLKFLDEMVDDLYHLVDVASVVGPRHVPLFDVLVHGVNYWPFMLLEFQHVAVRHGD